MRTESPTGTFQHLYNKGREVKWILASTEWLKSDCGFQAGDTQVFVAPNVKTFFFQHDFKNKGTGRDESRGQLDPCIGVTMRDVRVLNGGLEGFALVGPEYEWPQYLAALPRDCLEAINGQRYLDTTLGDYLEIRACRPGKDLECLIGNGIEVNRDQYAMMDGTCIRPGMGIRFNLSEDDLDDAMQNLHGVITRIDSDSDKVVTVRVLLARSNLPPCMDWPSLGPNQVFQTDIYVRVSLDAINDIVRIMPHQVYQPHGFLNDDGPCDLVVVGHLCVQGPTGDGIATLKCMPTRKLVIDRIKPLKPAVAFHVLYLTNMLFGCADFGLFGIGNRPHGVYRQYLSEAVTEFALTKCGRANDTRRDNTLHLNMFGPVLMAMLHDLIRWSDSNTSLTMEACVTIENGLVIVTIPTFQDARPLLASTDGVYDMTQFDYGFVQLYAPIAFKWEMYDTGCGKTGASRSVDGFTAISFESYVERDRHNKGLIKGTRAGPTDERGHNANKRQLCLPPSRCPR